jgi:hypothetical protein
MGLGTNLSETTQPNGFVTSRTVPETTGFERTQNSLLGPAGCTVTGEKGSDVGILWSSEEK